MIKCILVDDELPMVAYLKTLCSQLSDVEVVKSYNNPLKVLTDLNSLDFNTCVLDISMPGINGLQLAGELADKAVIFSTAHKEFGAEAYELGAVDYLRKPYQPARLELAFDKARTWLLANQLRSKAHIEANTDRGKAHINTRDVAYITVAENDRRDKIITLKDGRTHLVKNVTFPQLIERLPDHGFCQISRKTIIAIDIVASYTAQSVACVLPGINHTSVFSLTAQYRPDFLAALSR